MRRLCLVFIFLLWISLISAGQLSAAVKEECPECARQGEQFLSLYTASLNQEGATGGATKEVKLKEARDLLFKCLRYYGYSGMDADEIMNRLMDEVKERRKMEAGKGISEDTK